MRWSRRGFVISVVQTVLTAVLTLWADRVEDIFFTNNRTIPPRPVWLHLAVIDLRRIWRGVNAPTFPLNSGVGHWQFQIVGFSVVEILYLAAVAMFWYVVGTYWIQGQATQRVWSRTRFVTFISWGVLLFALAVWQTLEAFQYTFSLQKLLQMLLSPEPLVINALYAGWAAIIIVRGATKLRARSLSLQNSA